MVVDLQYKQDTKKERRTKKSSWGAARVFSCRNETNCHGSQSTSNLSVRLDALAAGARNGSVTLAAMIFRTAVETSYQPIIAGHAPS